MAYYDAFIASWNNPTQPPPGVTGNPLTGAMTTQQKLNTHNAWTVVGPAVPMIVPTYMMYNVVVQSEFDALTSVQQQNVRDILMMGTVDASPGTLVRSRVIAIFPNGTQTFTKLSALAKNYDSPQIPWWQGNNYPRPFDMGDCAAAGVS